MLTTQIFSRRCRIRLLTTTNMNIQRAPRPVQVHNHTADGIEVIFIGDSLETIYTVATAGLH